MRCGGGSRDLLTFPWRAWQVLPTKRAPMPKNLSIYFCSACGHESPKWLGRCPGCDAWNSFAEAPRATKPSPGRARMRNGVNGAVAIQLRDVDARAADRIPTGI